MKITKVEPFVLQVPLKRDVSDALDTNPFWGVPGCLIHTDEGIVGTGYTGTYSWGDECFVDIIGTHFAEVLIGEDPTEIKRLWDKLHWSNLHWVGRAGMVSMAHAAVDIALWDITAKAAGLPLHRMLGSHKPEGVPVYNTDAGWLNWTKEELVEDMGRLLEEGWTHVKMKVGHDDIRIDIDRVHYVREHLGGDFTLMVDANQKWNLQKAAAFAQAIEDLDIYWFEEPCHPDDVRSHVELARRTSIPLALGENVYSKFAFRDYLVSGAIQFVQADCTRLSGITEWLQVAGMAACYDTAVVPHHGDFAQVQQHLVAATPNAEMMEYIPWLLDVFVEPMNYKDGVLVLPETPGASTDFDPDAFAKYRIH